MPFKSFICRQANATAVRSLRAKIEMSSLATVNELKSSLIFCAQLSHCFSFSIY